VEAPYTEMRVCRRDACGGLQGPKGVRGGGDARITRPSFPASVAAFQGRVPVLLACNPFPRVAGCELREEETLPTLVGGWLIEGLRQTAVCELI